MLSLVLTDPYLYGLPVLVWFLNHVPLPLCSCCLVLLCNLFVELVTFEINVHWRFSNSNMLCFLILYNEKAMLLMYSKEVLSLLTIEQYCQLLLKGKLFCNYLYIFSFLSYFYLHLCLPHFRQCNFISKYHSGKNMRLKEAQSTYLFSDSNNFNDYLYGFWYLHRRTFLLLQLFSQNIRTILLMYTVGKLMF